MPPRRGKISDAQVNETFKINIHQEIYEFIHSEDATTLTLPATLSKEERKYIHKYATTLSLKSTSHGKNSNRKLTLTKIKPKDSIISGISLCEESRNYIRKALRVNPLTEAEINDVSLKNSKLLRKHIPAYRFSVGTFSKAYLTVPPNNFNPQLSEIRKALPIYSYRDEILKKIANNQVLVVSAETGSGKTTQIPQYILEECTKNNKTCRIICTQPRRIAAVSVCERVAQERGENVGQTVGYQIRLESRTSPSSNLIYCTNGIFLRCLMGDTQKEIYNTVSHIIVDEVHERDKSSDFLLISLKKCLLYNPQIKIILMSATIQSEIFTKYFYNCDLMKISTRLFNVETKYLDDILPILYKYEDNVNPYENEEEINNEIENSANDEVKIDEETLLLLNETLEICATGDDCEEGFSQFFYLVEEENIPVDFRHTKTDMTALMIAASKGLLVQTIGLIHLGADPELKSQHGYNSLDWALSMNQQEVYDYLLNHTENIHSNSSPELTPENNYKEKLLKRYQLENPNDDIIDFVLLYALIKYIHMNEPVGAILVILPGYDAIIDMNDRILQGIDDLNITNNIVIYMLHSCMTTINQKAVFSRPPNGTRKIILSTNIAETSITIEDVVYVIDSGKVKQKSYDVLTGSSTLSTTWISESCAKQRAGRAGRTAPGKCYRLYTEARFKSFAKYTIPEILRLPLTEICLQAKTIAPETRIADFLSESIEPPSSLSINQSIRLLITIGALDDEENLTALGAQLVDLPVDAQLGKVLIYSIFLKCVDPVLSIVSALSVKDPFILPVKSSDRRAMKELKQDLSDETYSDHLIMLRIFQKWVDNKSMRSDKLFCSKNFINSGSMETIYNVRSQILGYLRAVGLIQAHGRGNIHDLNQNSNNWALVKGCLVAGMYPNLLHYDRPQRKLISKLENIYIHPSSALNCSCKKLEMSPENFPTDWIVYGEKIKHYSTPLIQMNTHVTSVAVALFAGSIYQDRETVLTSYDDDDSISDWEDFIKGRGRWSIFNLDDWVSFKFDSVSANLLFDVRQKLNSTFLSFINNPRMYFKHERNANIIKAVAQLLLQEDLEEALNQPDRIGDRPKAVMVHTSLYSNQSDIYQNDFTNCSFNSDNSLQNVDQQSSDSSVQNFDQPSSSGYLKEFDPKSRKITNVRPIVKSTNFHVVNNKYFIVKAASMYQVHNTFKQNTWHFSTSVFKHISKIARTTPQCNIILFFNVAQSKEFVGAATFVINRDRFFLREITRNRITFTRTTELTSCMCESMNVKSLVKFYDGEEVPEKIGESFLQFLQKEIYENWRDGSNWRVTN